jgi:hypothetical protein
MIQSRPVIADAAGYPPDRRRQVRRRRLTALAVLLAAAALVVALVRAGDPDPRQAVASRYVAAWSRGDLRAMHALLTPAARDRVPFAAFASAHRRAARTATVTAVRPAGPAGEPDDDGRVPVPLAVATRAFGTVRQTAPLPVEDDGTGEAGVAWARHLAFPGARPGERLARTTALPRRAALVAADGTTLAAAGPARTPADPTLSAGIAGTVGPVPPERRAALLAAGVPEGVVVGTSGLERALDDRLRGRPGGTLTAGRRVLARTAPVPAPPVRTTIRPAVQRAAVTALAGRLGGVLVLHPRTGAITAAAGIALTGLQPPGSTFKVVTLSAGLEAGLVGRRSRFPVETATTLEGVRLENANGEACGGSLTASFAESCNTVFAPLGAKLGARRLVAAAERFGFNRPPGVAGAATSTLPAAGDIGDDLAVGSTAIGQGRLQATTLQVALLAATIANEGRRVAPTFAADPEGRPAPVRVVAPAVAAEVGRMMRAVVREGTGTGAALPDTGVAGKTGTAELGTTVPPPSASPDPARRRPTCRRRRRGSPRSRRCASRARRSGCCSPRRARAATSPRRSPGRSCARRSRRAGAARRRG